MKIAITYFYEVCERDIEIEGLKQLQKYFASTECFEYYSEYQLAVGHDTSGVKVLMRVTTFLRSTVFYEVREAWIKINIYFVY